MTPAERREAGLRVPAVVTAETEQSQESQDPLQDFFEARCEIGAHQAATRADVWAAYVDWSKSQGGYALGRQRFNALLETHGFTAFRDGTKHTTPGRGGASASRNRGVQAPRWRRDQDSLATAPYRRRTV